MYLCLCHGLNERAVHQACREGASTAGYVYRHFGVKPQCGKCVRSMQHAVEGTYQAGTTSGDHT